MGNTPTYFDSAQHKAAKYYSFTEHAMVPELVVFSKKRWGRTRAGGSGADCPAAKESVTVMRQLWRERDNNAQKGALSEGTIFVKDIDKESFRNAMRPVYDKFVTTAQQKSLFHAIKTMS